MAADVSGAPKHNPDDPDVQGDEYDPKYDGDRSGDHNKAENDARAKAKEDFANEPPGPIDEKTRKPLAPVKTDPAAQ